MRRKFNPEERKITKKNLKKQRERLKDLWDMVEYQHAVNDLREKFKDYLARQEEAGKAAREKAVEINLKKMEEEINLTEETIKVTEDQLKNGVEKKAPIGV